MTSISPSFSATNQEKSAKEHNTSIGRKFQDDRIVKKRRARKREGEKGFIRKEKGFSRKEKGKREIRHSFNWK